MIIKKFKEEKGLILTIAIVSLVLVLSIFTFISTLAIKKNIWKYRQRSYKIAAHEIKTALKAYMLNKYFQNLYTSSGGIVFPEHLIDLLKEGYLSGSDYHECRNGSVFTLCYKGMPVVYYRSILAQNSNCQFVINSEGHIYSGFAVVIVQGPKARSLPENDVFYNSHIRNAVETSQAYVSTLDLDNIYAVHSGPYQSDDEYFYVTANDIAKDFETKLVKNLAIYAHILYAKFRKYISFYTSKKGASSVAMTVAFSNIDATYSLCQEGLRYASEFNGVFTNDTYVDLGYLGYIPSTLANSNIKDMKGNYYPLRFKCILVDSSNNKYDLASWPSNNWPLYDYNIEMIDSRLEVLYDKVSTNPAVACPIYQ